MLYIPANLAAQTKNVEVDLQLVLAVDSSGSVPISAVAAQREAFADAFLNKRLHDAILSGPIHKIAITYFEFSDQSQQQIIVPWMSLSNANEIRAFSTKLKNSRLGFLRGDTSISGAMKFAQNMLLNNNYISYRIVLDITGNGRNNNGPNVKTVSDALVSENITINALSINSKVTDQKGPYNYLFSRYDGPIDRYYKNQVIGGPRSFVLPVDKHEEYVDAILRKLLMEIAFLDP
jgi:hypothetical protein